MRPSPRRSGTTPWDEHTALLLRLASWGEEIALQVTVVE